MCVQAEYLKAKIISSLLRLQDQATHPTAAAAAAAAAEAEAAEAAATADTTTNTTDASASASGRHAAHLNDAGRAHLEHIMDAILRAWRAEGEARASVQAMCVPGVQRRGLRELATLFDGWAGADHSPAAGVVAAAEPAAA